VTNRKRTKGQTTMYKKTKHQATAARIPLKPGDKQFQFH